MPALPVDWVIPVVVTLSIVVCCTCIVCGMYYYKVTYVSPKVSNLVVKVTHTQDTVDWDEGISSKHVGGVEQDNHDTYIPVAGEVGWAHAVHRADHLEHELRHHSDGIRGHGSRHSGDGKGHSGDGKGHSGDLRGHVRPSPAGSCAGSRQSSRWAIGT